MSRPSGVTAEETYDTAYNPDQTLTTNYDQTENNAPSAAAQSAPAPTTPAAGPGTRFGLSKNLGALREIPVFEPENEGGVKVGDFLEAVENAAFLGNLDPDDLMKIMPMRLRGPAKSFFRTFLASKQVAQGQERLGALWPDFKKGLSDRFRRTTDPMARLLQLTSCQQGDTETVRGYAQRVKDLAYKTWPQFTQSQDETTQRLGDSLIYQHFLKGLKPDNIERIHLKGIRDIETAILELTNKETFAELQRSAGRQARVNSVGSSAAEVGEAAQLRSEMAGLKETVTAHMAETAELLRAHVTAVQSLTIQQADGVAADQYDYQMSSMVNAVGGLPRLPQYPILRAPTPAPRGLGSAPPRLAGPSRASVSCFNCGGPHFRRNCPSSVPNPRANATGGGAGYRMPAPQNWGAPWAPPHPRGMGGPSRPNGPVAGAPPVPPAWAHQQGWGQNWTQANPTVGGRSARQSAPPTGGQAAYQGQSLNW